jgi:hypothetical protein
MAASSRGRGCPGVLAHWHNIGLRRCAQGDRLTAVVGTVCAPPDGTGKQLRGARSVVRPVPAGRGFMSGRRNSLPPAAARSTRAPRTRGSGSGAGTGRGTTSVYSPCGWGGAVRRWDRCGVSDARGDLFLPFGAAWAAARVRDLPRHRPARRGAACLASRWQCVMGMACRDGISPTDSFTGSLHKCPVLLAWRCGARDQLVPGSHDSGRVHGSAFAARLSSRAYSGCCRTSLLLPVRRSPLRPNEYQGAE